jgi:hypothetical protein
MIYPNPAHDFVKIEFDNSEIDDQESMLVQIFEISSSKLMHEEVFNNQGINSHLNLDISNFNSGVYLVAMNSGSKIYFIKFVKQ